MPEVRCRRRAVLCQSEMQRCRRGLRRIFDQRAMSEVWHREHRNRLDPVLRRKQMHRWQLLHRTAQLHDSGNVRRRGQRLRLDHRHVRGVRLVRNLRRSQSGLLRYGHASQSLLHRFRYDVRRSACRHVYLQRLRDLRRTLLPATWLACNLASLRRSPQVHARFGRRCQQVYHLSHLSLPPSERCFLARAPT
jgi:hypothetical protein